MTSTHQGDSGRPILLVDDDLDHRYMCRELFEQEGYVVDEVGDGKKALARLTDPARVPPCLILLDLSMPLMDGWALLETLQHHGALRTIPVVLISGEDPGPEAIEKGPVAAYLRKPYEVRELLALAARLTA
jgi:CheY-like chemotaxis protein